jgi:hypothetical protein
MFRMRGAEPGRQRARVVKVGRLAMRVLLMMEKPASCGASLVSGALGPSQHRCDGRLLLPLFEPDPPPKLMKPRIVTDAVSQRVGG